MCDETSVLHHPYEAENNLYLSRRHSYERQNTWSKKLEEDRSPTLSC